MTKNSTKWIGAIAAMLSLYCIVVFGLVWQYNERQWAEKDRLLISGGGFIFNYRIAQITAGITVSLQKPIPDGAEVVAELVYPQGESVPMKKTVRSQKKTFVYATEPLSGIEADTNYIARVVLVNPQSGEEIERHEKEFGSGAVPTVVPHKALTVGPGYWPNPALFEAGQTTGN